MITSTMSFLIYLKQFNMNNVYLDSATVNANLNTTSYETTLTRILYSTPRISLNPIGIIMQFVPIKISQHYNNKWSIHFDASHPVNAGIIEQFCKIESDIVHKFMHSGLADKRHCVFANNLKEGFIKTDYDSDMLPSTLSTTSLTECQFVLYINGLLETPTEYGISCKFAKW